MPKSLTITWRNEQYGKHQYSKAAFRMYDSAELSDTAVKRIQGKARKAGFTFCHERCAWIADDLAAAHAFVAGLADLGFEAAHSGTWSALPAQTEKV